MEVTVTPLTTSRPTWQRTGVGWGATIGSVAGAGARTGGGDGAGVRGAGGVAWPAGFEPARPSRLQLCIIGIGGRLA
jgi:hypothetical protein